MRLIITGSRDWPKDDRDQFFDAVLDIVGMNSKQNEEITFIVGDCPTGIDSFMDELLDKLAAKFPSRPFTVHRYPANWKQDGVRAGLNRNLRMVNSGADYCLAFTWGGRKDSRGTKHCAIKARTAGISVKWFHHKSPSYQNHKWMGM